MRIEALEFLPLSLRERDGVRVIRNNRGGRRLLSDDLLTLLRIRLLALGLRLGIHRLGRRLGSLFPFRAMSGLVMAMAADVVRNVLESQLRRVLAAPIGQPRADRLGVFESRN